MGHNPEGPSDDIPLTQQWRGEGRSEILFISLVSIWLHLQYSVCTRHTMRLCRDSKMTGRVAKQITCKQIPKE
jgi:hypothetical protein